MMKLLSLVTLANALVALPRAAASSGVAPTNLDSVAVAGDSIVARGHGFEISRRQMDQVLATALLGEALANASMGRTNKPELPPDAEMHVLSQLIEIQLVLQKATDAEKAEGRQKADVKVTNIVKTMGDAKFGRQLKTTHMTADDLRLMLYEEDTAQTSLTRQLEIRVTDADAKKYFDDNPGAFDQPEKARIRELLLLTTSDFSTSAAPPLPAATIQARHKEILDLHQRALAGADFTALARQYNEDPVSKGNDGELSFARDQMEFGDLAFAMKPNQISEVVTNTEGYRFFQLLEIIPAQKSEFTAVADKIKKMLTGRQKRMLAPAYLQQLRKEAGIEILEAGLKVKMAADEAEAAAATEARADFVPRQPAEATNSATGDTLATPPSKDLRGKPRGI